MWADITLFVSRMNSWESVHDVVIVVQSLSRVQLFVIPEAAAHQAPLSSLSPRVCSNSRPLSWWHYPSNPLLYWSLYWSFSFSISPTKNTQGWFPLGLTGLISLYSSFLASRTAWTVWKGKKIWHHKMSPQVGRCPICYWWRMESNY